MSAYQALDHLAPKALQNLIDRYYAGERVSVLMHEFSITCPPSMLYRHFPPEQADLNCSQCNVPLMINRNSRTRIRCQNIAPARCPNCGHKESPECTCPACRLIQQRGIEEAQKLQDAAIENFCTGLWSYKPIDLRPQKLSALEAIALLALIRCGGWIDKNSIGSLCDSDIPFAPQENDFKNTLLQSLLTSGLIAPLPRSPSGSFVFKQGTVVGWEAEVVHWCLLFADPPAFIQQLESMVELGHWPEGWYNSCAKLWLQLAAAECWEFCAYSVAQRNLPMPSKISLNSLIENLLCSYSVAQCYQLIWVSTSDATDYRVRKHTTAQHAANYLVGACQRRADRSRAEGWSIKGFRRNFNLPRSQVSHILHDLFLKHVEAGFTNCPTVS